MCESLLPNQEVTLTTYTACTDVGRLKGTRRMDSEWIPTN